MSGEAFVDTAVLVAAAHRRDQDHDRGLEIVRAADRGTIGPLLLTDFVLAETVNYLVIRGGSEAGREALDRLETSRGFSIERTPDTAYITGKNEVLRRFDGLSFVDAVTVAFVRNRGIDVVYTFDDDFDGVPGIERRTHAG